MYEVDTPHPQDGRTLLHSAVKGIPSPLYEYLVNECGATVDARDSKGRTPLLYAAANGSPRAIARLIALGADEKAVDNEGCGGALIAAQSGQIRTVQNVQNVLHIAPNRHCSSSGCSYFVGAVALPRRNSFSSRKRRAYW